VIGGEPVYIAARESVRYLQILADISSALAMASAAARGVEVGIHA
jgi:hypothetical protein